MKRIGKYEILEELGQGGMGIVYKARDPIIGRDVAIKVVQERTLHAPALKERFYREARSAGRLSHPNITTLYDIGEDDDGSPYLVMEFLGGTDLRTLLHRHHAFTLQEKIDIARQICEGLQYAHQNNVIHRDIKPDNIRVLAKNRVKIMDFGIARLDTETKTLTKESIGTPRYMSPEQIRGDTVDGRTDIFSFGVLFYELLTGLSPFDGERVTTVIYKILHEEPPPIELDDTPLADELQHIVERCLEKDPAERYSDFGAVLHDLSALLAPPTGPTQTLTGLRERPSASTAPASAPSPSPSRRYVAVGLAAALALAAGGYVVFGPALGLRSPSSVMPGNSQTATPRQQPSSEEGIPRPAIPAPDETDSTASNDSDAVPQLDDEPAEESEQPSSAPSDPPESETASADPSPALSTAADSLRQAMEQARDSVVGQRNATTVAPLFQQAESSSAQGDTHYETGNFAAAVQAFQDAESLYVEIGRALAREEAEAEQRIRAQRTAAESAQTRMQRAKSSVGSDRQHHAEFQQANRLESDGRRALDDGTFPDAESLFDRAAALYAETATLPTQTEEVQQSVQALMARCKAAFEREDLDALRSLSDFYGSWANFFELADDITANLTPEQIRLDNGQATVTIRFELEYKDNKNRTQRNQFTHAWTLTQRDHSWVLADVIAQ